MGFKRNQEDEDTRYRPAIKNKLTETQLRELDKKLQDFIVKKEVERKGKIVEVQWVDKAAWIEAMGGTKDGAVVITNYTPIKYNAEGTRVVGHRDCDPIVYEQLLADWEQYQDWKGRREYAEKKRLEELEANL